MSILLAAHMVLEHNLVDMATHYHSRWDVSVELRVDAAGAATFHISGTVASKGAELTPARARTVLDNEGAHIDETWTGRATVSAGAVVVHFDTESQHGHPYSVDVAWRCDQSTTPVSGIATPLWKCATSQNMTRPSGAAHSMPTYFQVPTYLAAPPIALRINATSRGGADHRSTMESVTLTR